MASLLSSDTAFLEREIRALTEKVLTVSARVGLRPAVGIEPDTVVYHALQVAYVALQGAPSDEAQRSVEVLRTWCRENGLAA